MAEIISVLWILMEMTCFYFFCESYLQRRPFKTYHLMLLLISTGSIYIYSKYGTNYFPSMLFTPLVYLIVSFGMYKGLLQRRIMAVTISVVTIAIVDASVMYLLSILFEISIDSITQRKYTYISAGLVSKSTSVLISWLFYRLFSKTTERQLHIRWLIMALFFPAISYMLIGVIYMNYRNESDLSGKALGVTLAVAIANIGTMYLITQIERSERRAQRAALLDQQMNIQTQSILSLEKSYCLQRSFSHDFQHHLNVISTLLEKEQYTLASQYIHKLQEQHTTRLFVVNSHHPIVDAVLNQKYQEAQGAEIDMQVRVTDLSNLCIPTERIVVVLSNLLDNAIEACKQYSGIRSINFTLIQENKLFLSIGNTSNPVNIINGKPLTTKKDKRIHGYGLLNVEKILKELNAEYVFNYQDNWFSFVAEIPDGQFVCEDTLRASSLLS